MTTVPSPSPCGSCPYRRDVLSGVWSEDEYAKLPPYDNETAYQPPAAFFCHQQDGKLGAVPAEDVDAILDCTTEVPLFESGAEAAAHGLADLLHPGDRAVRVVQKLDRKLKR